MFSQALIRARIASSDKQRRLFGEALAARDWKSLAELCGFHDLDPDVDALLRDVENMDVRVAWLCSANRTSAQIEAVLDEDDRVGVAEKLAKLHNITAGMARVLAAKGHTRVAAALVNNAAVEGAVWKEIAPAVVGPWAKSRWSSDKLITTWGKRFARVDGVADTAVASFLEAGTYDALLAALHVGQTDKSVDRKLVAAVFDAAADYIVSVLDSPAFRGSAQALFDWGAAGTRILSVATKFDSDVLADPAVAGSAGRLGEVSSIPPVGQQSWIAYRSACWLAAYGVPATDAEVSELLAANDASGAASLALRCERLSLGTLEAFAAVSELAVGNVVAKIFLAALEDAAACGDGDRLSSVATLFADCPAASHTHLRASSGVSVEVAEALLIAVSEVPNASNHNRLARLVAPLVAAHPHLVGLVPAGVASTILGCASAYGVADDVEAAKAIGQWWHVRVDANPHLGDVFDSVLESASSNTLSQVWAVVESLDSSG